jgi:deoxyribonuclease-4
MAGTYGGRRLMTRKPTLPGDRLGMHVSTAGGVFLAPARAAALRAGAFQIFTRNQNQWRAKPLAEEAVKRWLAELTTTALRPDLVCSHASYLVNLASPDRTTLRRSRRAFRDEIERSARLGIPFLILHPGSHVGRGEAAGLAAVARNLDCCLEEAGAGPVPDTDRVTLCLETTAGQGTNLGHVFAHLRDIIALSRYPDRLGICLDTCHVFAAGYGLRTTAAWRHTLGLLDTAVGLDRVLVLHLNDSQREQGSRVDRHARIGQGKIGAAPFRHILRTRRLATTLKILEIPGGDEAFGKDLALLRRLVRQRRRRKGRRR